MPGAGIWGKKRWNGWSSPCNGVPQGAVAAAVSKAAAAFLPPDFRDKAPCPYPAAPSCRDLGVNGPIWLLSGRGRRPKDIKTTGGGFVGAANGLGRPLGWVSGWRPRCRACLSLRLTPITATHAEPIKRQVLVAARRLRVATAAAGGTGPGLGPGARPGPADQQRLPQPRHRLAAGRASIEPGRAG